MLDPRADVYAFVLFYFGSLSGIFTRDFFIRDFYSGSYSLFGVVLAMCFCLECLFVVLRIYCFRIFKFIIVVGFWCNCMIFSVFFIYFLSTSLLVLCMSCLLFMSIFVHSQSPIFVLSLNLTHFLVLALPHSLTFYSLAHSLALYAQ